MKAGRLVAAVSAALGAVVATAAPLAAVTPSGATVPENLLRIELHLRRPLTRPLSMDRVRLVAASGESLPDALLDLPLPDRDGRTITLLLDPARVKTGVGANRALGRALQVGEEIELVVDDPQLDTPLRKRWQVAPPVERAIADGLRVVDLPRAGTRRPIAVMLDAPLTASAAERIAVRGPDGERIDGTVALTSGETRWAFRPARQWNAGRYTLALHPLLEDVAGNRPGAPFEARKLSGVHCPGLERAFDVR